MKWLSSAKSKSKKGMASFYIVIFTTMLFGVVTLSFMRIVLSETGQSNDDDLSRSAYDSAMAGVEDAKTAVNRYYDCLNKSGETPESCGYGALFKDNCQDDVQYGNIGLAKYLYGDNYTSGEVLIQENSVGSQTDNNSDQAYTCVIVSDKVPDYRGSLTADTRTKVIPVRISTGQYSDPSNPGATVSKINKIRIQWYSTLNQGDNPASTFKNRPGDNTLHGKDDASVPPTLSMTYLHAKRAALADIDRYLHQANNNDMLTYSSILLLPNAVVSSAAQASITKPELRAAGNIDSDFGHTTFPLTCSSTSDFSCSIELTSLNIESDDSAFVILSLPYGDVISDFVVTLYEEDNSTTSIDFVGAQISVDSTGRTNQLVRRVESRLDPADLFFPYPQYEIELSGHNDNVLDKNFWITANCWFNQTLRNTQGYCANNGNVEGQQ